MTPFLLNIMHLVYVGDRCFTLPGKTSNTQREPESFYQEFTRFTYRLIPLPQMKESWSVRRYTGQLLCRFNPNLVQQSVYPFDDFPKIPLHIPYHFVIVNAGKKLFQLYGLNEIDFERAFPFLQGEKFLKTRTIMDNLRNIYVAWNVAQPDPARLTPEANDDKPIMVRLSTSGGESVTGYDAHHFHSPTPLIKKT
ncbi:hypothetical protein M413DRAFT_13511 [Hebeloma cylindrosporum]|uniref:Uncharacterized protein n=1 Tax=Hebeloma cylindrosporum TaxID=76867 RepID=A0A0C3BKC0_HEBCY|nr:hypothetical protein M413DRAFT_13511 [Hebeloma cylindrosporum h7]